MILPLFKLRNDILDYKKNMCLGDEPYQGMEKTFLLFTKLDANVVAVLRRHFDELNSARVDAQATSEEDYRRVVISGN